MADGEHRTPQHVLAVFQDSDAGRRALRQAVAIADEHGADLSVVALVPHEPSRAGCVGCGVSRTRWNAELDRLAQADLQQAQALVGARHPEPRYEAVSGTHAGVLRDAPLGSACDVIVVPDPGRLRRRHVDRLRQGVRAGVMLVG